MSYPTWSDLNNPSIVPPLGARQANDIGPAALMVSTEPDLRFIKNNCGQFTSRPFFMGSIMTRESQQDGSCIAGPYIGAPYGVMLMESMIAKGTKNILILGWCGAISKHLVPGDLVVPDRALVDEGTSRHYMDLKGDPAEVSSDPSLSDALCSHLADAGKNVHRLPVWSTDAIYRETRGKVDWFKNKGAHAVDMECSALFSAASYRKVRAAALLVVSDSLVSETGDWDPGFRKKKFKSRRQFACKSMVEMIGTLAL
ncbi:MAG: nucleoside phosphorylase [Desulfobacter sp.]|nr:nucleoside phosphorylase [Desulfobacter sp.]WDP86637.1 MAG: nucleoside phosphorylase [Desulfobacter sp.]